MPRAVSLADWALTREPRRERARVVARRNMMRDVYTVTVEQL
jgi:hypothetical protein